MKKDDAILSALQKKGHRITMARKAIAECVHATKKPFSVLDMQAMLAKKGYEPNKVTVYRELAFLEAEGFLKAVTFDDGVQRYEGLSDDHHHHLVCTSCRTVQDIEMDHDLDVVEKKIRKEKLFKVQSHSLEFYGLCARCA